MTDYGYVKLLKGVIERQQKDIDRLRGQVAALDLLCDTMKEKLDEYEGSEPSYASNDNYPVNIPDDDEEPPDFSMAYLRTRPTYANWNSN